MARIYRRFWQVNWAEQWQYRANLVMYLLYWVVSPVVYLSIWSSVARAQGNVQGLTANDFVTYYLALLVVDVLRAQRHDRPPSRESDITRARPVPGAAAAGR